jgi:hypothetical protein
MEREHKDNQRISRFSLYRKIQAEKEGRIPFRNGRSPYFEDWELEVLYREVLLLTLSFRNPRLRDVSNIV